MVARENTRVSFEGGRTLHAQPGRTGTGGFTGLTHVATRPEVIE